MAMSFLSELKKQKNKLKETETIVTNVDGKRFIEKGEERQNIAQSSYGFVVDTKPDDVPVMIIDYLYIGSQDCTTEAVIEKYNIRHVLSLGINVNVSVDHEFVECLDLPETDIRHLLEKSLRFIRKAVECKDNVLVHCNAGVSRTSTVTIAYLMQFEGMSFDTAYRFVKEKRPAIQPNAGFRKQLQALTPGNVI